MEGSIDMYKIKRENPKPLYIQLEELIRNNIEEGIWKRNTAIPSENEMNRLYGVSRMTIRSACSQLVQDGVLYRVPGKGTFVAEPKIMAESLAYMGFREQLERMGYEITTELLNVTEKKASLSVANRLQCPQGSPILEIERLRFLKGEPISLHYSRIPYNLCKNLSERALEEEQLCVLLEKEYNLKPSRVMETFESVTASKKESKLFKVPHGFPLLVLEDILYDKDDKPFEYSKVIFRGDKIKLKYEYRN
ncbi:GntR family transcriptional regulator [Acetobacterium bakii]|uniref:Transcriptional regulator n=1 Tax=Acetobacterium bakii TaxID=52689 RepID=A0A0L6U4U6_9FIRM|nr:GntR family transcriptional regulator [Acetobacterium bakii]KNZ43554.1 transcriptional regulator [Acetobacterium bakii]